MVKVTALPDSTVSPNYRLIFFPSIRHLLFSTLPMANDKEKNEEKVVVAEFSVSMHCNACERSVARAISKCKGVEKFTTDMKKHKAIVTGTINPQKILKKLKKKTGKRVEIMVTEEEKDDESSDDDEAIASSVDSLICWDWKDSAVFEMFNEENANACSVM